MGAPLRVVKPDTLPYVREGRFCGKCRYFVREEIAKDHLRKTGFWDKVFHGHDDGHDLKPEHVGNPNDYSICDYRGNAAVHFFSTCAHFKPADSFFRFFVGGKK